MKNNKNLSKAYTFLRATVRMLLMVCMVGALFSCKDAPCKKVAEHEAIVKYRIDEFNELGFWDGVLEGTGLSSKCRDKADALRVAIEDYRAHLVSCKNSNCRAIAKNEIEACDKAIKELNEFKDYVSICAAINKLALILCGM